MSENKNNSKFSLNIKIKRKMVGTFEIDPNKIPEITCLIKKVPQDFDKFIHIVMFEQPTRERISNTEVITVMIPTMRIGRGYIKDGKYILDQTQTLSRGEDMKTHAKIYAKILQAYTEELWTQDYEAYGKNKVYYDITGGKLRPTILVDNIQQVLKSQGTTNQQEQQQVSKEKPNKIL